MNLTEEQQHLMETFCWVALQQENENTEPDVYEGGTEDVPYNTIRATIEVYEDFKTIAVPLIEKEDPEEKTVWADRNQLAHDFILTSLGHGTGFWDRYNNKTPEGKLGTALTKIAETFNISTEFTDNEGNHVYL